MTGNSETFSYTGIIQTETIAQTGTYQVTATGAGGGSGLDEPSRRAGGAGAEVTGDIYLTAGTVLDIVVGQQGTNAPAPSGRGGTSTIGAGGGGGGSFIFEPNSGGGIRTLIAVAGGGGGGSADANGGAGQTGSNGGGGDGANGGKNGAVGQNGGRSGGGGGGYTGGVGGNYATGGAGSEAGTSFAGGAAQPVAGKGGYGGGGGGGDGSRGGGGGGGGGGGYGGGGGGSNSGGGGGGGSYDEDLTTASAISSGDHANGHVTITLELDSPCFARGTHILSMEGEILVETIKVGDALVIARPGGALTRKVVWTGKRTVDIRRHPEPELVRPIRIIAGAIAQGVPERDLRVSPEHAVYLDGSLFTAGSLVNDTTIFQEQATTHVTYHHIELETHDILMAEGLACESFLDTGNKNMFDAVSGVIVLHPDFTPGANAKFCVPLLREGPVLDATRAALARRAKSLTKAA